VRERKLAGQAGLVLTWLAILMSLYHILHISGLLWLADIYIEPPAHRAAHIGFSLTLGFLLVTATKGSSRGKVPWYDLLGALLAVGWNAYVFFFYNDIQEYVSLGSFPLFFLIPAAINILLVFEIARRTLGAAMPLIAAFFVLYAILSRYLPGFLRGNALSFDEVVRYLGLWVSGIYGEITQISASVVISFLIFAAFLQKLGAGEFFIRVANSLVGNVRGGPAKIAIFASGLLGTLMGSATANVTATGVVTIPMMKKIGYTPDFAGAVEAVASNGGQLSPPVLGLVGFIMADFLGMPYWQVAVAATLPAILYYTALFFMVDFEAARTGIKGLRKEELPSLTETLKEGSHFLVPMGFLLYFIVVVQYSPQKASFYSLLVLIMVSCLRRKTRPSGKVILEALQEGAKTAVMVAVTCAVAGVITGALEASGLVGKLAAGVVWMAGGNLLILLVLTAFIAFLMGMGVTSAGVYILVALLIAPALIKAGLPPLVAHMYVYYFAMAALITPPVCIAAFVAAGIAESDPFKTGWKAVQLGVVTFISPVLFIYKPGILLIGPLLSIFEAAVSGIFAMVGLASGIQGYLLSRLRWYERVLLLFGALCLLWPGWISSCIGYIFFGSALFLQLRLRKILETYDRHPALEIE
jgi:TRAP transporter 4TM/12TM fusion protein